MRELGRIRLEEGVREVDIERRLGRVIYKEEVREVI